MRVLVIGQLPELMDFSDPDVPPGLSAAKVRAALDLDQQRLRDAGFEPELYLTDHGETAAAGVGEVLRRTSFDCVVIGAGVRVVGVNFALFETVINTVHALAPQAKIAFNQGPDTSAEAARRWLP